MGRSRFYLTALATIIVCIVIPGCATKLQTAALVGGATYFGARTPGHEIEQIFYLGSYDPRNQLPPTIYRVRVHGQASVISNVNFASGWVPAEMVDSLGTSARFNDNSTVKFEKSSYAASYSDLKALEAGRRLTQFGPEGFREVPKDHRLIILMGANPDAFFQAIDTTLGQISKATVSQKNSELLKQLFAELQKVEERQKSISSLENKVDVDISKLESNIETATKN